MDLERQEADAFAQKALETLRIGGVRGELHYDPERFLIQLPGEDGGQGLILYLTNLYQEYRAAPPGMKTQVLERVLHIQQAPDLPEGYAEVGPALLPVVRPRSYFEMRKVRDPSSPLDGTPSAAWRPLGEVLAVSLVHDLPETMRYIGPSDLERWGISFDED
ncbi:MAG TPA: hypothetical protein VLQ93_02005, partial [Myxococcaceae bacterium]|nr:hypothetical protein [Myxococcaceae bacterium]